MKICVTGGAGYIGCVLVPMLLDEGHEVTVLDTFWFGDELPTRKRLRLIRGDIRSKGDLERAFCNQDAIIHLACVSNDPSFDMNPDLGRAINYTCFRDILQKANEAKVRRFIYASSSSVYGVSTLEHVIETSEKKPLTDYSKFKLQCELELMHFAPEMCWTIVRPATVCGYSPRQRLDLVVNILTAQAVTKKEITLHGGGQCRPNIHIHDMARAYVHILNQPEKKVQSKIYNVGFENLSLNEIAKKVQQKVGKVQVTRVETVDERSYRVNSDFIRADIGFKPHCNILTAIGEVAGAIRTKMVEPGDSRNYNIKRMKELCLV